MSLKFKMEYLKKIYERYHKASKEQKGQILQEFCKVCNYHRKHAIRLLSTVPTNKKKKVVKEGVQRYGQQCIRIIEEIWKASGHLCSQRLKEAIPLWMPYVRKRYPLSAELEQQILTISARQIDYRLKDKKRWTKKRIYSTTRPGTLLKHMIPIRTHNWDIKRPGFLEIDLVAHCGNSNAGTFIYTLDSTDIHTAWSERVAVLGKGQTGIIHAMLDIKNAFPSHLRGIDSDNGEEFINYALLDFCIHSNPRIQFTRGRPYKKDDNAHIEQKNWTHVRQIFGWDRYESQEALERMNDLYANELRFFQNFFQPSMKLIKKVRVGSKLVRKYDQAKTPFQRVLESKKFNKVKVKKLREQLKTLDPFELSQTIDRKLDQVFKLTSQRIQSTQISEKLTRKTLTKIFPKNLKSEKHLNSFYSNWCYSRKTFKRKKMLIKAQNHIFSGTH